MKVLLITNNCEWATWPAKIAAIKAFYAPLVALEIDIRHTSFVNVPLSDYPGLVTSFVDGKAVDTQGTDTEVDQAWFRQNIVPLIGGYDIAIFQLGDVAPRAGLPLGITFGEFGSTWCCETFVNTETSNYYLPGMIDYGDLATVIIEHEIAHALYSITLQHDRTHELFYSNQFSKVLTDIVLPAAKNALLVALYKKLISLLQQELGIIKQQQSRSDPTPPPHDTIPPMPQNNIDTLLPWISADNNRHNVRVLCDLSGLSLAPTVPVRINDGTIKFYTPKDVITACVKQESNFDNNAVCKNTDATGKVTSIDVGLVQMNSFYHCGPGKEFSFTDYVVAHPQSAAQWMIDMYKAGKIGMWVSFSSGAFRKWLPK